MKITILLIIVIVLIITTGCNEDKKQEVKKEVKEDISFYTIQYYLDHKDLREQRIKECKALIKMTSTEEKDCNNVETAEYKSKRNKLIEL